MAHQQVANDPSVNMLRRNEPKTNHVGNTFAQLGRVPGGIAQGTLKPLAAQSIMLEQAEPTGLPSLTMVLNRFSGADAANYDPKIVTKSVGELNTKIENWTNSWIPPPASGAAQFTAKASDALGEAIPGIVTAVATGGANATAALAGTTASHFAGGANAFTTEMLEGSGNIQNAAIAGVTEFLTEAGSAKLLGGVMGQIKNPVASWAVDSAVEGIEEAVSGFAQAKLTGESYSVNQALEEFALGAAVGSVAGGGISGINAVNNEIGTAKTVHDIRSGKGGGALEGLSKSIEIAQANPEQYGNIAHVLSTPAQESRFDTAKFRNYVESAVEADGNSSLRVPSNVTNIDARNVGGYETLTADGMRRAASVLEAAQIGKGLSPRQSGNILRAVIETNSNSFAQLGQIPGQGTPITETVQIALGKDYRDSLPESGGDDNFSVVNTLGRPAQTSEADRPINIFRGMSSEWVIPTIEAGEFVVPNPAQTIELGSPALFGSGPGQMLGAGLYLTSIPSKADQYTSGVPNEISLQGRDSSGIMESSVLIGGTTYINDSALSAAEQGKSNNNVRMGKSGDENALKDFVNKSSENPESAAIYSKIGKDYTEIVRPDTSKTQIDRLYIPLQNTAQTVIENEGASAYDLGRQRAEAARAESISTLGSAEVNTLFEQNIRDNITTSEVAVIAGDSLSDGLGEAIERQVSPSTQILLDEAPFISRGNSSEQILTETNPHIANEDSVSKLAPSENDTGEFSASTTSADASAKNGIVKKDISESASEIRESSSLTSESQSRKSIETATKELPSEERSSQIWTPLQLAERNAQKQIDVEKNRRKENDPPFNSNILKGSGSAGRIFESSGYNSTFGGLTSY